MLMQAMTLVTIIVVVTAALLTSSLVNAKIALQQTTTRHITAALSRGTDELTNWAQRYVAKNSASTTWPTTTQNDAPRQICNEPTTAAVRCPLNETTTYAVVGSTIASGHTGPDTAENLQQAVHENRIGAVVTATIRDASGDLVGARTRQITLRVFDAAPFAVVTGAREFNSLLGNTSDTQGDTAGYKMFHNFSSEETPSPIRPNRFRDTRIQVTITCSNSVENANRTDAFKDNHSPGNDGKPFGTSDPGYEAPCSPTYTPDPRHSPPTGVQTAGRPDYDISSDSAAKLWSNGNASSLPLWKL